MLPAQVLVALRFLLRRPHCFVIPKATTLAHLEDNAAADRLELGNDEFERIDAAFPRGESHELPVL